MIFPEERFETTDVRDQTRVLDINFCVSLTSTPKTVLAALFLRVRDEECLLINYGYERVLSSPTRPTPPRLPDETNPASPSRRDQPRLAFPTRPTPPRLPDETNSHLPSSNNSRPRLAFPTRPTPASPFLRQQLPPSLRPHETLPSETAASSRRPCRGRPSSRRPCRWRSGSNGAP